MSCIFRGLFMSDSLSSVWGHSDLSLSDVKIFERLPHTVFKPNFMESIVIRGSTSYYFLGGLLKVKNSMALQTFC